MDWLERIGLSAAAKGALAIVIAVIATVFGEWAPPMTALGILMVADFLSGWLRASEQKDLSSEKAWKGTARKFGMVGLLVILGQQMDTFLETGFWRHAIVLFFCASEGLSILENAVAVGLPVPDWLRGILVQLKERKYVRPGEGPSETPPPAPWSG
jgi:toxin secretion/phage lysis holin